MKLLISLVLLSMVIVNGLTSYHLFRSYAYDLSNLLYIAAFASMVFSIFVLTTRKSEGLFIK